MVARRRLYRLGLPDTTLGEETGRYRGRMATTGELDDPPEGLRVRPGTTDDAEAITTVINDVCVAQIGVPWITAAEIRDAFRVPPRVPGLGPVVLVDPSGVRRRVSVVRREPRPVRGRSLLLGCSRACGSRRQRVVPPIRRKASAGGSASGIRREGERGRLPRCRRGEATDGGARLRARAYVLGDARRSRVASGGRCTYRNRDPAVSAGGRRR